MTGAEGWIRERLAAAPPRLLEAMIAALPTDDAPVPDALAEAAASLYRNVCAGADDREAALPLLAADALFTHAFQARAEQGPGGVEEFARRWGAAGRLGELAR